MGKFGLDRGQMGVHMSTKPRKINLPDHANELDTRALAIDRVGIKGLRYPIRVLDRENREQNTVATINAYVGLPQEFKGTHMSRFLQVLAECQNDLGPKGLHNFARELAAAENS